MKSLAILSEEELANYYTIISANVKQLRLAHNKPQLDLVLEMGMKSTSFYSKFENAKHKHHFNLEHLIKISKILGVGMNRFFDRLEDA